MFEKFIFSTQQIKRYWQSAKRDLSIAKQSPLAEVKFRFAYDSLLKLAIAVCAVNNLRVKADRGHHIELINKLAELLNETDIAVIANQMRSKRNWDLYGGGVLITDKEAKECLAWVVKMFIQAETAFGDNKLDLQKILP